MRSHDKYKQFIRNYWKYYLELENEFLATRKYVDFSKKNFGTYSIEFLKLFQAVCSEVDTIGKAMACEIHPVEKPFKDYGSITKWWYVIQKSYQYWDDPSDVFADDGCLKDNGKFLKDVQLIVLDELSIIPWSKFETEKCHSIDKNGIKKTRIKNKEGFRSPTWWKAYTDVKHNRTFSDIDNAEISNYSKANLKNLSDAFGGLYVLEKSYMESIGTMDDLDAFYDDSQLFNQQSRITRSFINSL